MFMSALCFWNQINNFNKVSKLMQTAVIFFFFCDLHSLFWEAQIEPKKFWRSSKTFSFFFISGSYMTVCEIEHLKCEDDDDF